MINYRAIRNWGCPYCSGRKANQENCLQTVYPDLAKQWHPNKNGTLTPDQVGPNSTLKVWWRCQAGHEWEARVVDQAKNKKGCAICLVRPKDPENCLMATHPSLAKEWHSINNTSLSPRDVTADSLKVAWWICEKGHSWRGIIAMRTKEGLGCPECKDKFPF